MPEEKLEYTLDQTPTGIESFLFIIGLIILISSIIVGFMTWPSYANSGLEYIPALGLMFSGIFTFSIFLAISKHLQNQRKLLWVLTPEDKKTVIFGTNMKQASVLDVITDKDLPD